MIYSSEAHATSDKPCTANMTEGILALNAFPSPPYKYSPPRPLLPFHHSPNLDINDPILSFASFFVAMDTFYDVEIPTEAFYAYHAPERRLYRRMVLDIGTDPGAAMRIIAFWLWLQEAGYQPGVIALVSSFDDRGIQIAASLAHEAVGYLRIDQADPPADLPAQNHQIREEAVRGIHYFLRSVCGRAFDDLTREAEEARRQRMDVLVEQMSRAYLNSGSSTGTVDSLIAIPRGGRYDDRTGANRLRLLSGSSFAPYAKGVGVNTNAVHGVVAPTYVTRGEGSSRRGVGNTDRTPPGILNIQDALQYFDQQLNTRLREGAIRIPQLFSGGGNANLPLLGASQDQMAASRSRNDASQLYQLMGHSSSDTSLSTHAWWRRRREFSQDERTLFVTFSNGYPLTEEDLYEFFMKHYGDVEMIDVPIGTTGKVLYACVVFYSVATVFHVLDGKATAKFMYKGRHLWARRYKPRKPYIPRRLIRGE